MRPGGVWTDIFNEYFILYYHNILRNITDRRCEDSRLICLTDRLYAPWQYIGIEKIWTLLPCVPLDLYYRRTVSMSYTVNLAVCHTVF